MYKGGRVVFFFSSRRRHTRWPRDWSSDVCSSDLTREILPEDRDYLDRVVRRARDGGLEPSAVLVGEEVGERTQEAVCIVVGVHAPQELRPAFVREGPREERGLPDPGDANDDGNGPRVGGEPSLQDAKLVLAAEERPARDRGRLGGLRSGHLDDVGGEDPLDGLGLPQARVAQRVDCLGPEDGSAAFWRRQLDRAGPRVLPHAPPNPLACRRQLVHLPTRACVRDVGHPLLHLARRLESLHLVPYVLTAQQERVRDSVLGHLDGTFVRVRVTQKSGEVDENPLSHSDTGQSPRPLRGG